MSPRGKRVTASQIGQYSYCAYAWWLAVIEGREPTDLEVIEAGTEQHQRHGWQVSVARGLSRVSLALFGLAVLALLIWVLTYL